MSGCSISSQSVVVDGQPDRLLFRVGPADPVSAHGRDGKIVAGGELCALAVVEQHCRRTLQYDHSLMARLFEPARCRRSVSPGGNPFDLQVVAVQQRIELLCRQRVRNVPEYIAYVAAHVAILALQRSL